MELKGIVVKANEWGEGEANTDITALLARGRVTIVRNMFGEAITIVGVITPPPPSQ